MAVIDSATRAYEIKTVRDSLGAHKIPLAMTECHFVIPGRDRGDVVASWAAGVSYARILNNHERHGDVLKIANLADYCGTRWQTNAVMIPGRLSADGRALAAMGPQVGYYSPQIFSEYELHGGGIDASGVTFPGASP